MRIIKKKILPEYFEAILSGKKKFELRLGDLVIAEGDTLVLEEFELTAEAYTGRSIEKKVTDVASFKIDKLFWPKEEVMKKGIQIISFD
jgi:ASC-1-like (ASCH) protein